MTHLLGRTLSPPPLTSEVDRINDSSMGPESKKCPTCEERGGWWCQTTHPPTPDFQNQPKPNTEACDLRGARTERFPYPTPPTCLPRPTHTNQIKTRETAIFLIYCAMHKWLGSFVSLSPFPSSPSANQAAHANTGVYHGLRGNTMAFCTVNNNLMFPLSCVNLSGMRMHLVQAWSTYVLYAKRALTPGSTWGDRIGEVTFCNSEVAEAGDIGACPGDSGGKAGEASPGAGAAGDSSTGTAALPGCNGCGRVACNLVTTLGGVTWGA